MVTFDSRDPGTASQVWTDDPRWGSVPPVTLDSVSRLVVLAAHPDDETLGAGGLIATACASGVPVTVVVVTDGAAAPDVAGAAGVRASEVAEAVAALGVRDLHLLGFADGRVREDRAEITELVLETVRALGDAVLVAPWSGDGHRDHRVLGEIAIEVASMCDAAVWAYPIWLWHWATPEHPDVPWATWARFSLSEAAARAKADALRCFESQTTGDEPMLHARFLEHFARPDEMLVVRR